MKRMLLIGACLLAGCKGGAKDDPPPAPSAPGAAADPWAAKDAAADTPERRKQRAEAALGRVAEIKPKLAALRGLAFEHDVPTGYQLTEDFRAFVHREIAAELPPEKSRAVSAAMLHLGLLAKPIDLAQASEEAATTQAGAYYDPKAKRFFLVMVPTADMMLDVMSAHELTHALQDQHFDLTKYMTPGLDDDAASARRAVVEGDGTFTMMMYALGDAGAKPAALAMLRPQLEKMAEMTVADFKQLTATQAAGFGDSGDLKRSIEAMDTLPPVILVPMIDAYMKGAVVIMTAYEKGGWPEVDKLYTQPPESTEQIMHPTTKLYPARDRPQTVTLAKLADHEEVTSNVMGEALWSVYFELWQTPRADEAAAGWDGDRYAVVRRMDGRSIGLIATVWDSEDDAQQFLDAYAASLARRHPGAAADLAAGVARSDAGKIFAKRAGTRVYIVDGADDRKLLDWLVKTTTVR